MAVKPLLENHTIEEVVDKIIERFHNPLPDLIENINKKWNIFFHNINISWLESLKDMFYNFTSVIITHILDEEENWFPLLIKKIHDPFLEVDSKVLHKIAWEHYEFDIILDKLEEKFKIINLSKKDPLYEYYIDLLNDFSYLQSETKKHLEVEVQLTKEFLDIMKKHWVKIEI